MDIIGLLFGRPSSTHRSGAAPALLPIEKAPAGAHWRAIRPHPNRKSVRARLAVRDGVLETRRGPTPYRAGEDYIVHYTSRDSAVVKRTIFERLYRARPDGRYQKRGDVVLRYFTLDFPVTVMGLEGAERADAGDWIIEGVAGELYPVKAGRAAHLYSSVEYDEARFPAIAASEPGQRNVAVASAA